MTRPRITVTLEPLAPSWYTEHPEWPTMDTGRAGEAEWRRTAHAYLATLHNGAGGAHVCPYYTGSGWTTTPSARDILSAVVLECVDPDQTFEDWCADYGYDNDSRRALAMFEHAKRETPKLEAFLGPQLFTFLREHDESEWPDRIDTSSQPIAKEANA